MYSCYDSLLEQNLKTMTSAIIIENVVGTLIFFTSFTLLTPAILSRITSQPCILSIDTSKGKFRTMYTKIINIYAGSPRIKGCEMLRFPHCTGHKNSEQIV
jgi:hypothetical protein